MKISRRAAALVAALLATGAVAQPAPPSPLMHGMPMPPIKRADVASIVTGHFAEIDANHDGAITEAEIRAFRRARIQDMVKAHRDRAFAMLDANHDGSLSRAEFDAPPPPPGGGRAADRGAPPPGGSPDGKGSPPADGPGHGPHGFGMVPMGGRWFERADANQDGKVTLAEAQAAALALFDKADANHDGTVDPGEARAMMMARFAGPHGPGRAPGDRDGLGDMPPPPSKD